jgi:uncharacterized protein (TIGR03382 family)
VSARTSCARAEAFFSVLLLVPALAHGQTYTVIQGQRVERSLNVPCALEFDLTNKVPSDELVEEHLAWAVTEGMDWAGGNAPLGTYSAAYRDYKLKVYGTAGFAGEQRINVPWAPASTYQVRAEIKADRAVYVVKLNGAVIAQTSVSAVAPPRVTLGYGWPPSVRNGAAGAVLSNIRWEESSVTQPPPATLCPAGSTCFEPVADTWADPNQPAAAHGGDATLQVGGDGRTTYLRFDLSGLGSVATARLQLEASNAGGITQVHAVTDNAWTEAGLTFGNRPSLEPTALDSRGRVEIGSLATFDVIAAIPAGGVYSLAIRSADLDGSAYHSKDSAARRPVLIVTEGPHPTPPPPPVVAPPDAGVPEAPDAGTPVVTAPPVAPVDAGANPPTAAGTPSRMEATGGCSSVSGPGVAAWAVLVAAVRRRRAR